MASLVLFLSLLLSLCVFWLQHDQQRAQEEVLRQRVRLGFEARAWSRVRNQARWISRVDLNDGESLQGILRRSIREEPELRYAMVLDTTGRARVAVYAADVPAHIRQRGARVHPLRERDTRWPRSVVPGDLGEPLFEFAAPFERAGQRRGMLLHGRSALALSAAASERTALIPGMRTSDITLLLALVASLGAALVLHRRRLRSWAGSVARPTVGASLAATSTPALPGSSTLGGEQPEAAGPACGRLLVREAATHGVGGPGGPRSTHSQIESYPPSFEGEAGAEVGVRDAPFETWPPCDNPVEAEGGTRPSAGGVAAETVRSDAEPGGAPGHEGEPGRALDEALEHHEIMRLVLESANQGFVTLDPQGRISAVCSAVVGKWFGVPFEGELFGAYLRRSGLSIADWFEATWQVFVARRIPTDIALQQMPGQVVHAGRTFDLDYVPIERGEEIFLVLVIVSDITVQIEVNAQENARHELLSVFRRIHTDRESFLDFFRHTDGMVKRLDALDPDRERLMRDIHTIKANVATFGLSSVADICHELEEGFTIHGKLPSEQALAKLHRAWCTIESELVEVTESERCRLSIRPAEYDELLDAIRDGEDHESLEHTLLAWQLESTELRLGQFAEQVKELVEGLGKPCPEVVVEHGDLRLSAERWSGFWSAFVHVIRNAVDHGIEEADERIGMGKLPAARLLLRTVQIDGHYRVECKDDGRGVDWESVASLAREQGLPHGTRAELTAALFAPGLSTRSAVSEVSGRGIGMSVVGRAVADMQGEVSVFSEPGRGTLVTFTIPVEASGPRAETFERSGGYHSSLQRAGG